MECGSKVRDRETVKREGMGGKVARRKEAVGERIVMGTSSSTVQYSHSTQLFFQYFNIQSYHIHI